MFEKPMKKLIIVTDEKSKPYANYLMALVSAKDDKDGEVVGIADGTVEAVVWSEKAFADNEPTLSSNAHILFMGDTKLSKSQRGGLTIKFDDFGLKYGWLGKRAVMYVDRTITNVDEYNHFYEFALNHQQNFSKAIERKAVDVIVDSEQVEIDEIDYEEMNSSKKVGKIAPIATFAAAVVAPFEAAKEVSKGVVSLKERKVILQQQQSCLTMLFYLEALNEFLEG